MVAVGDNLLWIGAEQVEKAEWNWFWQKKLFNKQMN